MASAIAALLSLALAQDQADLAKQSQNPIANLISLSLQNNTFFGIGPNDDTANVLNIQPEPEACNWLSSAVPRHPPTRLLLCIDRTGRLRLPLPGGLFQL